jgi:hypothetical protein
VFFQNIIVTMRNQKAFLRVSILTVPAAGFFGEWQKPKSNISGTPPNVLSLLNALKMRRIVSDF